MIDDAGGHKRGRESFLIEVVSMDDLTRGVKSVAKNIEHEIPKIGSAIGETFKNITSKRSKKQIDDKPATPNK